MQLRHLPRAVEPLEFDDVSDVHQDPPELSQEIQHQANGFYAHLGELVKLHERTLSENHALRQRISQIDPQVETHGEECQAKMAIENDPSMHVLGRPTGIGALPSDHDAQKITSAKSTDTDRDQTSQQLAKRTEIAFRWLDIITRLESDYREQKVRSHWETSVADSRDLLRILDDLEEDSPSLSRIGSEEENTASLQLFIQHVAHKGISAKQCASLVVMQPSSVRRGCWTFVSLIVMLYDAVVLSVQVYQNLDSSSLVKTFDRVSLIFWTLDIAVSFISGVYVDGELQVELTSIAKQYVRSWFWIDVFIVAPLWASVSFEADEDYTQLGQVTRVIKLTRYLRVVRLAKLKGVLFLPLRELAETHLGILAAKIAKFFAGMLLWVHVSGCLWYSIGDASEQGWVHQHGWDSSQPQFLYFISLHWAAAQLQGSVDINPGTTLEERAYSVFAVIMSVIILACCLGKLTNIMMELQSLNSKSKHFREVRKYLASNKVSLELTFRVHSYLDIFGQVRPHGEEFQEQTLLAALPIHLRRAIITEVRGRRLVSTSLFLAMSKMHKRFFERICCDALKDHCVLPDELLWGYGDTATDVYFISGGKCFYTKYNTPLINLSASIYREKTSRSITQVFGNINTCKAGTCVSEPVLWTQWTHRGDLNSMQHCNYFTLSENQFSTIARAYAQTWGSCAKHAKVFVAYLNTIETADWSDMIGTSELHVYIKSRKVERWLHWSSNRAWSDMGFFSKPSTTSARCKNQDGH